jgi:hypothetical protein
MELTFANELDVVRHSPRALERDWPRLVPMFCQCKTLVSAAAWDAFHETCRTGPARMPALCTEGRS